MSPEWVNRKLIRSSQACQLHQGAQVDQVDLFSVRVDHTFVLQVRQDFADLFLGCPRKVTNILSGKFEAERALLPFRSVSFINGHECISHLFLYRHGCQFEAAHFGLVQFGTVKSQQLKSKLCIGIQ